MEMKVKGYTYTPSQFTIVKGMPVEFRVDGREAAGCARVITLPKLGITKSLSSSTVTSIEFTPDKIGNIEFMCTMAMTTRGAKFIIVENNNQTVTTPITTTTTSETSEAPTYNDDNYKTGQGGGCPMMGGY